MRRRTHAVDSLTLEAPRVGSPKATAALPPWAWPLAIISAVTFSLAGIWGDALNDAGWSAGAVVITRLAGSAALLIVPAITAIAGRWYLLRDAARLVIGYGVLAIAGAQLCFFQAIQYMPVGIVALIEYSSPLLLVGYMWARHGKRPGPATILGVLLASVGLLLVLDLSGAVVIDPVGLAWAGGAAIGLSAYFLFSADEAGGLPPITMAAAGMTLAASIIGLAGLTGVLPMVFTTNDTHLGGVSLPWWVPAVGIAFISGAFAYVSGIMITRLLGANLGSFVAYLELLGAFLFGWMLLGQVPTAMQALGGLVLIGGIAAVKFGERPRRDPRPGRNTQTVDAHV